MISLAVGVNYVLSLQKVGDTIFLTLRANDAHVNDKRVQKQMQVKRMQIWANEKRIVDTERF
jgi:hypothetical protein